MSDHARRDKRYPSMHLLLVQCDTWSEFAELYATDVSQGGMFIATDDPPPILSEIGVTLKLPEGHEIGFKANVVHVIDAQLAQRENRAPGVGVHFVELDPVRKLQIQQLVEFARSQGTAEVPTASYASRMFEVSTSLPPSKVLDALPLADPLAAGPVVSGRPLVAPPAQPEVRQSKRATPAPRPAEQVEGGESRRTRRTASGSLAKSGDEIAPAQEGAQAADPPKPTDPAQVKLGMTHIAHKQFAQAIKTFEAILRDSPGDRQVLHWMHIAHARLRLKSKDEAGAAEHYQKALEALEDNHEARKFVRQYSTKKRLNSIPFGRYFVKKD